MYSLPQGHDRADLLDAVRRLPPRECRGLTLRFGLDGRSRTFEEVASEPRLTATYVRRLEHRGLLSLRSVWHDQRASG